MWSLPNYTMQMSFISMLSNETVAAVQMLLFPRFLFFRYPEGNLSEVKWVFLAEQEETIVCSVFQSWGAE